MGVVAVFERRNGGGYPWVPVDVEEMTQFFFREPRTILVMPSAVMSLDVSSEP